MQYSQNRSGRCAEIFVYPICRIFAPYQEEEEYAVAGPMPIAEVLSSKNQSETWIGPEQCDDEGVLE